MIIIIISNNISGFFDFTKDITSSINNNLDPYKQYMKVVDCYELAPHAGRVILVDSKMKLQKAFKVLIEWDVGAVVVWCSRRESVIAILTLTDFLISLLSGTSEESTTVEEAISSNQLVWLGGSCKLLEACHEFSSNRIHRIVIYPDQNGDVLYLLTIKRILQAVHKQNRSLHFASWLDWDIKRSKIGTWKNLQTVCEKDNLEVVARKMLDCRISSLPIIDDENRPVDVICKTDIAYALADAKKTIPKLTTMEAIKNRQPMLFLSETDTVNQILDFALSQKDCRCVFVTNPKSGKLTGAISLSDFITHILYSDLSSTPTAD
ncbi:Cystathionine beta-synthase domain containing protein [Dirofilaria immitis]|nr:Cystathionine beta-synthase domain containing protein [Dirofilaria immitis]